MQCPDHTDLIGLREARLDGDRRREVSEHIESCEVCRAVVESAEGPLIAAAGGTVTETATARPTQGTDASEPPTRPKVIGRYVIDGELGSGGMGIVYAAHDPELNRRVAIKLLKSPKEGSGATDASDRLLREAQAMARLNHRNVITVHDVGRHKGRIFVAMELIDGGTLKDWLAAEERTQDEILGVFRQAAEGLVAAHEAGIIHRDFKPSNVLVANDGRVCVTDFGLARPARSSDGESSPRATIEHLPLLENTITRTGAILGTPTYMAPEQHRAERTTEATDQFGFCVALYEALYGEHPFGGGTLQELAANATLGKLRPAPKATAVSARLRDALGRGLSTKPADRYPSMRALLGPLQPRTSTRRTSVLVAGAALVVGVAAVVSALKGPSGSSAGSQVARTTAAAEVSHVPLTYTGNADAPRLSPDGTRLAYVTGRVPIRIAIRDLAGGEERDVISFEHGTGFSYGGVLEWLDNETLFISLGKEPVLLNTTTGAVDSVSHRYGWVRCATPSGYARARYSITRKHLWFYRRGATQPSAKVPVDGEYTFVRHVACADVGARVAVAVDTEGDSRLLSISADGGEQYTLVRETGRIGFAEWEPGGRSLIYQRFNNPGSADLRRIEIRANGSAAGPPTTLVGGVEMGSGFAISPAGDRVYYARARGHTNLWRGERADDRSATWFRQFTKGTASYDGPSISPDGQTVAAVITDGLRARLSLIQTKDGSERTLAVLSDNVSSSTAWSPAGDRIAFATPSSDGLRLTIVNVETGQTRLAKGVSISRNTTNVVWSPTSEVLFLRPGNRVYGVYDPANESVSDLVPLEQSRWMFYPAPSPDGLRFAVFANDNSAEIPADDRGRGLWILEKDVSARRLLWRGAGLPIKWSRDGRWIYFTDVDAPRDRLVIKRASVEGDLLEDWLDVEVDGTLPSFVQPVLEPDERHFIVQVDQVESDIWVAKLTDANSAR